MQEIENMPDTVGICAAENTADVQLPVRDIETAEKLMELIKASIPTHARTSMLAQANVRAEGLILLLRNNSSG